MVESNIIPFGDGVAQTQTGIAKLGGKAVNLCRMASARLPVPPGFVVTTGGYRRFVDANGLEDRIRALVAATDFGSHLAVEESSARIRALFAEAPVPGDLAKEVTVAYRAMDPSMDSRVAVRSSATAEDLEEASFAGQQDTYLNIHGLDPLVGAIKSCWGSLWTARAMSYRSKQKVSIEGLALAVVVQRMVMADAAGVMFTANPLTGARDELVINASWGLGEAIVGGAVTPDTIVVEKATGAVKELKIPEKRIMTVTTAHGTEECEITDENLRKARVLSDDHVRCLADLGRTVEEHYGKPQDIEWALAGGEMFLLQARPVTALPEDPAIVAKVRADEIARLRKAAAGGRRVWVLHNISETLPAPTPLTWDITRAFMSGNGGFGRMYKDLGYRPSPDVCENGFLDLIGGRVYADTGRASDLFWDGMPLTYDKDAVARNPKLLDSAPTGFDPQRTNARFLVRLPGILFSMWRSTKLTRKARAEALERFEKRVLPPFLDWVKAKRAENLKVMTTGALLAELDVRIERVMNDFGGESLKPGFFGGMAQAALEAILIRVCGQEKGVELVLDLTQGLEGDTTVEQSQWLWEVARKKRTMEEFLDRFGHRAVEEMELARPRWREDDSYVLHLVGACSDESVTAPASMHDRNAEQRVKTEEELPAILAQFGASSLLGEIKAEMLDAQALLPYRESGKFHLMMGYETIRVAIVELGRRWDIGSGVFFLRKDELAEYESRRDVLNETIKTRRGLWQASKQLHMDDVVDSTALDQLGLQKHYDAASELAAEPIAPGVNTGTARLVSDPTEAADIGTDYVLVCRSTDPGWTGLFVRAKGLVVEQGGILSHGAIVARDFGIPAVVCKDAMSRIPDRALIRVDGNHGRIAILEQPSGGKV